MHPVYPHTCASCGKSFTSRQKNQQYCSPPCQGDHMRSGYIDTDGYRVLCVCGRRVKEHRYVMEQHLGRQLLPTEVVHHKNHDRLDNRIENLELIARAGDHTKIHVKQYRDADNKQCQRCGQVKPRAEFHRCLVQGYDASKQWCKACQSEYGKAHFAARRPAIAEALYVRSYAEATANVRRCENCAAPLDPVAWCPKCQQARRPCGEPHTYLKNRPNARYCSIPCKEAVYKAQGKSH